MEKNCSLFSHTRIKKNKIYVCLDWLFSLFLCENKLTLLIINSKIILIFQLFPIYCYRLLLRVVFFQSRIGNFSKSSWTKTEFFFGFSMKFCLEICYDLFFWTTYQGFRRSQSRKSEDFDQKTKSCLKSSVLGFINQETAQNDHNKILYTILG